MHDKLVIMGLALLNGDLPVIDGRTLYRSSTSFEIIDAERIQGSFYRLNLLEASNLVSFNYEQYPESGVMEVKVAGCAMASASPANSAVAAYLDMLQTSAQGDQHSDQGISVQLRYEF